MGEGAQADVEEESPGRHGLRAPHLGDLDAAARCGAGPGRRRGAVQSESAHLGEGHAGGLDEVAHRRVRVVAEPPHPDGAVPRREQEAQRRRHDDLDALGHAGLLPGLPRGNA